MTDTSPTTPTPKKAPVVIFTWGALTFVDPVTEQRDFYPGVPGALSEIQEQGVLVFVADSGTDDLSLVGLDNAHKTPEHVNAYILYLREEAGHSTIIFVPQVENFRSIYGPAHSECAIVMFDAFSRDIQDVTGKTAAIEEFVIDYKQEALRDGIDLDITAAFGYQELINAVGAVCERSGYTHAESNTPGDHEIITIAGVENKMAATVIVSGLARALYPLNQKITGKETPRATDEHFISIWSEPMPGSSLRHNIGIDVPEGITMEEVRPHVLSALRTLNDEMPSLNVGQYEVVTSVFDRIAIAVKAVSASPIR